MQFFTILALAAAAVAVPAPAAEPVAVSDLMVLSPLTTRSQCTPGTFACGLAGSSDYWIVVCDGNGNWQLSSDCGGACTYINGLPFCT